MGLVPVRGMGSCTHDVAGRGTCVGQLDGLDTCTWVGVGWRPALIIWLGLVPALDSSMGLVPVHGLRPCITHDVVGLGHGTCVGQLNGDTCTWAGALRS